MATIYGMAHCVKCVFVSSSQILIVLKDVAKMNLQNIDRGILTQLIGNEHV